MAGQPPWLQKKKPGNAAEDAADGGMDDAQETPVPKVRKKGKVPPQFQNAIARRLGAVGPPGMPGQ